MIITERQTNLDLIENVYEVLGKPVHTVSSQLYHPLGFNSFTIHFWSSCQTYLISQLNTIQFL